MNIQKRFFFLLFFFFISNVKAQNNSNPATFKIIPLGVKGGSDESNLSSYLLAPINSEKYICLDAGTLYYGIQKAIKNGLFKENETYVLKNNIKAYLISHPHLDHVAGLVLNSPDDSSKNIYALPFCIDVLKNNYFTWKNWANFGNEGEQPTLKKYHYMPLDTSNETMIANTEMEVKPFLLSHSKPNQSTAFLVRGNHSYLLYLGDTGADEIENSNNLFLLWKAIAPLIKASELKAIFIETSFPDEQPNKQLFGHLTPQLLMNEMKVLSGLVGESALKKISIVITHMKPSSTNVEEKIKKELEEKNSLHLHLLFPEQGKMLEF